MKSFSEIVETVYGPINPAERRFLKKHKVVVVTHPVEDEDDHDIDDDDDMVKDDTRSADYMDGEDEEVYEETIFEAIQPNSSLNFPDGTKVKVNSNDAKAINTVFGQLTTVNRKKMEKTLKGSRQGFDEILNFVREVV